MRRWSPVVLSLFLLLVSSVLSGCTAPEPPAEPPVLPPGGRLTEEGRLELDPPRWQVGQWWTFDADGPVTFVATGESNGTWTLETDDADRAFAHTQAPDLLLSGVRASDLALTQNGTPVALFEWPLYDGRNWTTQWSEERVRVAVTEGAGGVFDLVARTEERVVLEYDYDPHVGWFTSLTAYGAGGGPDLVLHLVDNGTAYGGAVARWTLDQIVAVSGMGPDAGFADRTVPAGVTDLWLRYVIICFQSTGGYSIWLRPDDPTRAAEAHLAQGPCGTVRFEGVVSDAPGNGTWRIDYAWAEDQTKPIHDLRAYYRTLTMATLGGNASADPNL